MGGSGRNGARRIHAVFAPADLEDPRVGWKLVVVSIGGLLLSSTMATVVIQAVIGVVIAVIVALKRSSFVVILTTAIIRVKTAVSPPKFINTDAPEITIATYLLSSYCLLCSAL